MKIIAFAAVALGLVLTSCATVHFYSPDVGPSWSSFPLKSEWLKGTTLAGARLQKTGEHYTVGKKTGDLFDSGYVVDRTEAWTVVEPSGYHAQIEVVQKGVVYQGSTEAGVLTVSSADWSQVTYRLTFVDGAGTVVTDAAPWKFGYEFELGLLAWRLTPYYGGREGQVTGDYRAKGVVTGYRITDGDRLVGYLDVTEKNLWLPSADATLDPPLLALVLFASRGHQFEASPKTLDVEGLSFNFFGLGSLLTTN